MLDKIRKRWPKLWIWFDQADFYKIFLEKSQYFGIIYLAGDAQPYK